MGKNKRKLAQAPAQNGAPAAAVQAAPDTRPGRRELLLFLCLAAGLILAVMWRPLSRGEVALNVIEGLEFEPWRSFPRFVAAHDQLLARPLVGRIQSIADAPSVFYPYVRFAAGELARGALPLWFPFADFGAPFLANQLSAVFDPFHIPFYLARSPYVYNLDAFLRLLFAGFFAFLFARRAGLCAAGACCAGGIALLAPSLGHLWSISSHARAIAMLPALLWVTEKYVQERSGRALLDLTALVAVAVYFGAPEISMDTFLQAGVYLLARLWQDGSTSLAAKARLAAAYVAAAAAAAVPAAVHLVPAVEYFRESVQFAARLKGGVRWDFWPTYTRPMTFEDVLPLVVALALGLGAWKAWDWLRRKGEQAPGGRAAAGVFACFACLSASLLLFLLLGMDETFIKMFLPTPPPPFRYGQVVLGGIFVEALAVLALLDPELPAPLRALFPGWLLAFAFTARLFGFAHLLAAAPVISLGYYAYHIFGLCILVSFWAAWGLERLWRQREREPALRRRAAALFAAAALLLPCSLLGCLYWENNLSLWAAGKVDVGLVPPFLPDGDGTPLLGFMGIGRQEKIFEINPLVGWYRNGLPLTELKAGILEGAPAEPRTHAAGDKVYFNVVVFGPGTPQLLLKLPDGPRQTALPRFEVLPVERGQIAQALGLWAGAAVLIVAGLLLPGTSWLAAVAGVCAAAELLLASLAYVPSVPKDLIFPANPVSEILARDASRFRIHSSEADAQYWPPASDSVFGLEDTRSCDVLGPRRVDAFRQLATDYLSGSAADVPVGESLLELANVKYRLTAAAKTLAADRFDLVYQARKVRYFRPSRVPSDGPFFQDSLTAGLYKTARKESDRLLRLRNLDHVDPWITVGDFKLYRAKGVRPRAMVFEDAVTVAVPRLDEPIPPSEKVHELHAFLDGRRKDFSRTLVLHDDSLAWARPSGGKPAPPREAHIVRYEPTHVELEADAPRGGWLFLSDTYFPGWRATVDGRESPIAAAWLAFRAVGLAPGRHRVVFEYRPDSFRWGLLVSASAWAVWLLFWRRFAWKPRTGFFGAPGEWVVEGIVLAELAFWLGWTVFHWLR